MKDNSIINKKRNLLNQKLILLGIAATMGLTTGCQSSKISKYETRNLDYYAVDLSKEYKSNGKEVEISFYPEDSVDKITEGLDAILVKKDATCKNDAIALIDGEAVKGIYFTNDRSEMKEVPVIVKEVVVSENENFGNLNLREDSYESSDKVGTIEDGKYVVVTATMNEGETIRNYDKIYHNDEEVYAASDYLSIVETLDDLVVRK